MTNLQYSTIEMLGYMDQGHHVETSVLANATYLLTGDTQTELFNVYGRIMLKQLYIEACTVFGAQATVLYYTFTSSTPVIAVQPISAVCGALTSLAQGLRIVWVGGAVATAAVITATAGISDVVCVNPHILGTDDGTTQGVGTIGMDTATASQLSGTFQAHCHYIPMSDGAYVTAAL